VNAWLLSVIAQRSAKANFGPSAMNIAANDHFSVGVADDY